VCVLIDSIFDQEGGAAALRGAQRQSNAVTSPERDTCTYLTTTLARLDVLVVGAKLGRDVLELTELLRVLRAGGHPLRVPAVGKRLLEVDGGRGAGREAEAEGGTHCKIGEGTRILCGFGGERNPRLWKILPWRDEESGKVSTERETRICRSTAALLTA
jgi:hypothetical protein